MKVKCEGSSKCTKLYCFHKDVHDFGCECSDDCLYVPGVTCQPINVEARKTPRKSTKKVSATRNKPNAEIFALLSKVKLVLYKNGLDETGDIVETIEQKLSAVR